ncbi:MAG: GGDEF domain-containing protein [Gammaproteobacteria bacterium]|nr:GGDEF domain-containing protein [Gammaproteobacteria bacterium]
MSKRPKSAKEIAPNASGSQLMSSRQLMLSDLDAQLTRDPVHNQTGLILIDIRDFRELNRSFGEACGNAVLQEIQQRLHELPAQPTLAIILATTNLPFWFEP